MSFEKEKKKKKSEESVANHRRYICEYKKNIYKSPFFAILGCLIHIIILFKHSLLLL